MARRSKAREVVLQMLYMVDLNSAATGSTVREMIAEELSDEDLRDFAWSLFAGTMEYRSALDAAIEQVAENWTLKRMAPTDRNALRLGAYELLHTDTPHRVVLDETIEVARKFGSEHSPQFVNGLMDRLIPDEKKHSPE